MGQKKFSKRSLSDVESFSSNEKWTNKKQKAKRVAKDQCKEKG